jgi:uncharacterized protein YcbK (DUF882 family)
MPPKSRLGRRVAVAGLAAATIVTVAPSPASARGSFFPPSAIRPHPRRLSLVSAHTGERFSGIYAEGDHVDSEALVRLNELLRDYRTGEVRSIDPALIELIGRIQARIGQPLQVLSGYRSAESNRLLRRTRRGVARNSLHMAGMAVDFVVPGMPARTLGQIARHCGAGGLGIYRSGFVHVDSGPRRSWSG